MALSDGNTPGQRNKIVLLGEQSAGKTSIVTRFVYDHFIPAYAATIGIDFLSKTVTANGKTMRLQLWDTAGQERFRSLMPSYIRDSSAAIVVYDITNRDSFTRTKQWVQEIKDMRGDKAVIVIVGNKTDLLDKRKVSYEEGESHAKEMNCLFRETSAKNGDNVHELFNLVAVKLLKTTEPEPVSDKLVDIDLKPSVPSEDVTCTGRTKAGLSTSFASITKMCPKE
ncbi:Ras-related rab6 small GTP-binding protein, putative [Theileria equi strain WA]|uniref:Ras-related rab6 small GTP-binding protein, putative n=1 Tax=Theileria equi strain WA TaxID=1537102 RepID=L0AYF0_THEEQ|nr:Ras-related rab6 small GTP-binding protein, putative [Theileria equi strain WA]AFZ79904.1 Ras-related rab6 small GTP-binding protein, putative [Theileria equi strain WA]|eukprot:XP_004829570.1 Ras-related rab6 small GTP-binding protein, putative [Theileria equi strain WA]